jgi:hypothetical protein
MFVVSAFGGITDLLLEHKKSGSRASMPFLPMPMTITAGTMR